MNVPNDKQIRKLLDAAIKRKANGMIEQLQQEKVQLEKKVRRLERKIKKISDLVK